MRQILRTWYIQMPRLTLRGHPMNTSGSGEPDVVTIGIYVADMISDIVVWLHIKYIRT